MKKPFKFKTMKRILIFVIFIYLVLPVSGLAATTLSSNSNFCKNFNSRSKELNAKLIAKEAQNSTLTDQNKLQLKNNREKAQAELEARRLKNDQRLDTYLNNLMNSAKTPAQQKAVSQFKTSIATTINTRRIAIDNLIKNFQIGLDKAVLNANTQIQAALKNYKSAVTAAENKAKTDCNLVYSDDIKKTFSQAMNSAKNQFEEERKKSSTFDQELINLKTTRDNSVKNANENFKNSVNQAAAHLKANFK